MATSYIAFLMPTFALLAGIHATAEEPIFVHIAEGYTSSTRNEGIFARQRMFSAPDFDRICEPLEPPARLITATPVPLRLMPGQWFAYDTLVVLAIGSDGDVLPPVPITLEVEEHEPELLNLRSDMTTEGKLMPIRAGRFRFRLSTICAGHGATVTIDAEVVSGYLDARLPI